MRVVRSWWPVLLCCGVTGLLLEGWYHSASVSASSLPSTRGNIASVATSTPTQSAVPLSEWLPKSLSAQKIIDQGTAPDHTAEGRLMLVLSLIEQGKLDEALFKIEQLIQQQPNFQLAHLVHGDLLHMRANPNAATQPDDMALSQFPTAQTQLQALRSEARLRLDALSYRPPTGTLPSQVLSWVGPYTTHLIVIDASRSRLYWFEKPTAETTHANAPILKDATAFRLKGDFYVSVGKSGTDKRVEGDGKTPLGVYWITSVREGRHLPDLYGSGALPLNYPNAVDRVLGKTGYGIWLHGTPAHQFVRAPLASDGCVVAANTDMALLLEQVPIKTTPVVIAERLDWVTPDALSKEKGQLEEVLQAWQRARSDNDPDVLHALIAPQFGSVLQTAAVPVPTTNTQTKKRSVTHAPALPTVPDFRVASDVKLGVADATVLQWKEPNPSFVALFEETVDGQRTGVLRQQHWWKPKDQWQLLQDTTLLAAHVGPSSAKASPTPPRGLAPGTPAPASNPMSAAAAPVALPKAKAALDASLKPSPVSPPNADIEQAVHLWAKAWQQQNIQAYFNAYAPDFDPPGKLSRSEWEKERRERILPKKRIDVDIDQLRIDQQGHVATVRFVQHYRTDSQHISSRKTLKLVKQRQRWLITQETVGG